MAAESAGVRVEGLADMSRRLKAIAPELRAKVLRTALAAGARVVRDDARRRVPVLAASTPTRKPGTVRNAIVVRTSKVDKRAGNVGVFVNVRPAKGAVYRTQKTLFGGKRRTLKRASQRGARSQNDPFYWRFLEFGTRKMSARPYLKPAAARLQEALGVIVPKLAAYFRKVDARAAVPGAPGAGA
jgi:HK97 gp10 family phage protein